MLLARDMSLSGHAALPDDPLKANHFDVMVRVRLIRLRTLISNWDTKNGFSIKSTLIGGNSLKLDTCKRLVNYPFAGGWR